MDIGITIQADITLSIDQVWPDGDAPENPTAQDVVNLLEECGSKRRALEDWCLLDDLDVWIDVGRTHAEAWAPTGVQQSGTVTDRAEGTSG